MIEAVIYDKPAVMRLVTPFSNIYMLAGEELEMLASTWLRVVWITRVSGGAYRSVSGSIAITRVIIIDGYVSSLTLSVLNVRKPNVAVTIYTVGVGQVMQRLIEDHVLLFLDNHIDIRKWRNESHDRWLIIDDSLYHCGHSLNANGGHKISAITLMGTTPDVILSKVE